jgi:hypothetical protein
MKNLRERFTLYPLGCESFGAEWLRRWEALGELLQKPARFEVRSAHGRWRDGYGNEWPLVDALHFAITAWQWQHSPRRVVLLDGTIVYEWRPK